MEAYAPIAKYYDIEHDQFDEDIEWYVHLAELAGPRVLELGCGSGRLLAPLVAAGSQVTGVDSSDAMLERARSRLGTAVTRGDATLIKGDMRNLVDITPGSIDLATIPLNGLLHVDQPDDQRKVLTQVAGSLRRGGLLALDVFHAVPDAQAVYDGRVMHEGTWELGTGEVSKFSSRSVDWTNQLVSAEVWYDETRNDGSLSRHRTSFSMRWVTPAELTLLLEFTGFTHVNVAGGYDGTPLTDMSDRILVAARKAESR